MGRFAAALAFLLLLSIPLSGAEPVSLPSPASLFGFEPGEDRKLASLEQILEYFRALDRLSPRVQVRELGETTMGHPFTLVLISSERNLARLGEIREIQALLADPRRVTASEADSLMRRVPAVVSINCSIHATEVGAAQMAPLLTYELLAGNLEGARMILDSVLVLLIPVHNPDGLVLVKEWYDRYVGTAYEAAPLPWLYHKYTGHDNNRDWFLFTQVETRLTVDSVYNVWHPQIVLDMHQMGSKGARLFVPPYVDPVDPNVDPLLVAEMNDLGTFVQSHCVERGLGGVVTGTRFDAFTPARAYPNYHGGIRFLSEVASCRIASPLKLTEKDLRGNVDFSPHSRSVNFPLPWEPGEWRLRDVVSYHRAVAHAVLLHAALHRSQWVRNAHRVLRRQCEWDGSPAGFLIPDRQWDPSVADELVAVLRRGGVEIYRAPRGEGLVVPLAQPYGAFAKTLLEVHEYEPPRVGGETRRPYDVTTHSLPLLFGVRVRALETLPEDLVDPVERFPRPDSPQIDIDGPLLLDARANRAFEIVTCALASGASVARLTEPARVGGHFFPRGSFVLRGSADSLRRWAARADRRRVPHATLPVDHASRLVPIRLLRIALYQSWVPSIDEGWTRWILEQYGFPFRVLHDSDVRSGALDSVDVFIIPHARPESIAKGWSADRMPPEYAGGLGEQGLERVRQFVQRGGTLVLFGSAVESADRFLGVDLCEEKPSQNEYYVPGALLRGIVGDTSSLCLGLPGELALMCTTPPLLRSGAGRTLVRFAEGSLLLSGWAEGLGHLRTRPALLESRWGRGRILAFAFRPQFRAWSRDTYKLLFNALISASQDGNPPGGP